MDELIAERAAEWLLRLETAGPKELDAFRCWLVESPLHVREVLATTACQIILAQLFRGRRIDAGALVLERSNVRRIDSP